MAVAAFLAALALGWGAVAAILPAWPGTRWAARAIEAALALGAGVALSSMIFFLTVAIGGRSGAVATIPVFLLAAGVVVWNLWRKKHAAPAQPPPPRPGGWAWNWVLAIALAAGFALVLVALAGLVQASPNGEWDAWSIWNLRARFLAAGGESWRQAFSGRFAHGDYPLLLSAFVGFVWSAAGSTGPWVPAATAFLFLTAVTLLLLGAVAILRGTTSALVSGFVLLASSLYLGLTPMLYSDLPLSFFILATVALALLAPEFACPRQPLALAGAFASFAAWTKNEGIAFLAAAALCSVVVSAASGGLRRSVDRWGAFLAGAAPGVAVAGFFKLAIAPAGEPLFSQSLGEAARSVAAWSRWGTIADALWKTALEFGQPIAHPVLLLVLLALLCKLRIDPPRRSATLFGSAALLLLSASDFLAYLVTPSDLNWQIRTSLSRVCAQLWPGILLLVFSVLRPIEDVKPAANRRAS